MSIERQELLEITAQVLGEYAGSDLTGYCGIASRLVESLGVGKLVHGHVLLAWELRKRGFVQAQHCWIVDGSEIIDLTASQFQGPKIHIMDVITAKYEGAPWGFYRESHGPNFWESWPEWQQPNAIVETQLCNEIVRRIQMAKKPNPSFWG